MAAADADPTSEPATTQTAPKKPASAPVPVTTIVLIVINSIALVLVAMGVILSEWLDLAQYLALIGIIAAVASAAVFWPRLVGHAVAFVIGATCLAAGCAALWKGLTPVLPVTLVLEGGLLGVLAVRSWQGSRAAWSFLIAMLAVEFICLFFGAPKVRGTIGVDIWIALIVPGLATTAVFALAVEHERYAAKLAA